MLNNTGPSQNEGFPFSSQFGQPISSQLGTGQNVFTHNAQKLGPARMAMANATQQQRQRVNGPPAATTLQLQQQHFATGQFSPASQQQVLQHRNAGPQTGASPLLGVLGQQVGRGSIPGNTAAFPSLVQTQQNSSASRAASVNHAAQYGNVNLDSYLGQQPLGGLSGLMPNQRGMLGQLDTTGRNGPAGINNLLHSVSQQQAKASLPSNSHGLAPSTSQPFGKLDRMPVLQHNLHPGHRLLGMVHKKGTLDNMALAQSMAKPGSNATFQGDQDNVFDTSDFPALGMGLGPDPTASSAMSAMLGNVQHIFNDSQYSGLTLPSSPAKAGEGEAA